MNVAIDYSLSNGELSSAESLHKINSGTEEKDMN